VQHPGFARKVLLGGGLAPALDHSLVDLNERMLEVQQLDHQPGRKTRTASGKDIAIGNQRDQAKQVQVFGHLASLDLPGPALGEGSFYLLPEHAFGQLPQWVAQIDHLIQVGTEKVIGHAAAFKNSQKTASIEYLFHHLVITRSWGTLVLMRQSGVDELCWRWLLLWPAVAQRVFSSLTTAPQLRQNSADSLY
jgi:hypothetical protein